MSKVKRSNPTRIQPFRRVKKPAKRINPTLTPLSRQNAFRWVRKPAIVEKNIRVAMLKRIKATPA